MPVTTRTKGSDTTSYLYRGLSEEQTKATQGSQATTYAYGAGGPIAQVQGGNVRAFLRDLHGDVVGLGTTTGSVAGTRSFDPWGEVRATTGETAWLGFQGDPTDPDTGLVDMLTRNYLPSIGRFTTGDVLLGELAGPASLNQFGYASLKHRPHRDVRQPRLLPAADRIRYYCISQSGVRQRHQLRR